MADIKWSAFTDAGAITSGDDVVGLRAGANVRLTANAFDNLLLDTNTLSSTDTNGDINITPDGSGDIVSSTNISIPDTKGILDENSNAQLLFSTTGSAVNYLQLANGATGNGPAITVQGEANVDLNIHAAGTGDVLFNGSDVICGDPGFEASGINIGGVTYDSALKVSDIAGANIAQFILHRHSTTLQSLLIGARANSNTSSHGAVTNGMSLLTTYGVGWTGTEYNIAGGVDISMDAAGTISDTSSPGRIQLQVTADGATLPTTALTIANDKLATFAGAVSAPSLSLTAPLPVTSGGTALSSTTANQLLYSSATNTISGLATGNNGLLVTDGSGVPSISNTISGPSAITLGDILSNQTFFNISGRAISANNANLGQVIDIIGNGINSTITGLQCNVTQQDAGVGEYTGIDVNTTTARTSGASARSYYGGYFKLNTPASASTASNMTYYGVRSAVTNATTGETSTTFGVSSVASGPSTVYGLYASATGGSTNWGVYSAAGTNHFVGPVTAASTITPSQTNGIVGTTTNNNVAAGGVGEYQTIELLLASAVSLTTVTAANVATISLGAGDWQLYGVVNFAPTSTTTWDRTYAWLSLSSATLPGAADYNDMAANEFNGSTTGTNGVWRTAVIPTQRFSLSGTTNIYLSAQATFGVSTMDAFGKVVARRVR